MKRYQNVRNTMNVLLDRGIILIINENDTVTINRLKFGDNDTLSAKVAGLIDADFSLFYLILTACMKITLIQIRMRREF